jgi:hypothetical protein
MFVFARSRRANPARNRSAMAFAVEAAGRASSITGHEVVPWTTFASPEVGRITWAVFFEHLAELGTAAEKLAADSSYAELVEKADAMFLGPPDDSLVQLLHGAPAGGGPAYAGVVTAELANGHFTGGVAKGIEIAQTASRVTGLPSMFGIGLSGAYAGVAGFTPASDLGQIEAAQAALSADPEWLSLLDGSGELFNAGAQQTIYRRLG